MEQTCILKIVISLHKILHPLEASILCYFYRGSIVKYHSVNTSIILRHVREVSLWNGAYENGRMKGLIEKVTLVIKWKEILALNLSFIAVSAQSWNCTWTAPWHVLSACNSVNIRCHTFVLLWSHSLSGFHWSLVPSLWGTDPSQESAGRWRMGRCSSYIPVLYNTLAIYFNPILS